MDALRTVWTRSAAAASAAAKAHASERQNRPCWFCPVLVQCSGSSSTSAPRFVHDPALNVYVAAVAATETMVTLSAGYAFPSNTGSVAISYAYAYPSSESNESLCLSSWQAHPELLSAQSRSTLLPVSISLVEMENGGQQRQQQKSQQQQQRSVLLIALRFRGALPVPCARISVSSTSADKLSRSNSDGQSSSSSLSLLALAVAASDDNGHYDDQIAKVANSPADEELLIAGLQLVKFKSNIPRQANSSPLDQWIAQTSTSLGMPALPLSISSSSSSSFSSTDAIAWKSPDWMQAMQLLTSVPLIMNGALQILVAASRDPTSPSHSSSLSSQTKSVVGVYEQFNAVSYLLSEAESRISALELLQTLLLHAIRVGRWRHHAHAKTTFFHVPHWIATILLAAPENWMEKDYIASAQSATANIKDDDDEGSQNHEKEQQQQNRSTQNIKQQQQNQSTSTPNVNIPHFNPPEYAQNRTSSTKNTNIPHFNPPEYAQNQRYQQQATSHPQNTQTSARSDPQHTFDSNSSKKSNKDPLSHLADNASSIWNNAERAVSSFISKVIDPINDEHSMNGRSSPTDTHINSQMPRSHESSRTNLPHFNPPSTSSSPSPSSSSESSRSLDVSRPSSWKKIHLQRAQLLHRLKIFVKNASLLADNIPSTIHDESSNETVSQFLKQLISTLPVTFSDLKNASGGTDNQGKTLPIPKDPCELLSLASKKLSLVNKAVYKLLLPHATARGEFLRRQRQTRDILAASEAALASIDKLYSDKSTYSTTEASASSVIGDAQQYQQHPIFGRHIELEDEKARWDTLIQSGPSSYPEVNEKLSNGNDDALLLSDVDESQFLSFRISWFSDMAEQVRATSMLQLLAYLNSSEDEIQKLRTRMQIEDETLVMQDTAKKFFYSRRNELESSIAQLDSHAADFVSWVQSRLLDPVQSAELRMERKRLNNKAEILLKFFAAPIRLGGDI